MQINNYNSKTSFGISIPANTKLTILESVPKDASVVRKLSKAVYSQFNKLEKIGSDKYELNIKHDSSKNKDDFVLRIKENSRLKNTTFYLPSKKTLLSKFFALNDQKIKDAIKVLDYYSVK